MIHEIEKETPERGIILPEKPDRDKTVVTLLKRTCALVFLSVPYPRRSSQPFSHPCSSPKPGSIPATAGRTECIRSWPSDLDIF